MKRLAIAVVFLSVLSLSSVTSFAQNWPSFRGPNASGVAEGTNPPLTWDLEKSHNVLWKTAIPGLSHATPIVWGNNIFVITAVSADSKTSFAAKDRGIDLANDDVPHTWIIYAIDKRNGQVLWSNKAYEGVPRAKRHVKATQANSTPVTDGRYVAALFGSEGLACYDMSGKLAWKLVFEILRLKLNRTAVIGSGCGEIVFSHEGIRAIVIGGRNYDWRRLQGECLRVVCNGAVKVAAILSIEPAVVVILRSFWSLRRYAGPTNEHYRDCQTQEVV